MASLYRQVPGIAMFYGMLEIINPQTWQERMAAGCFARSTATIVFLPMVVIKTQIEWGAHKNITNVAKFVYKNEGLRGWSSIIK